MNSIEYNKPGRHFILPELSPKEGYRRIAQSSSCLVYASSGLTECISIETVTESELQPKLQANEVNLTPVVRLLPQEVQFSVSPAIVELMKTVELNNQNPNHELVPLYSLSHPFEWKKLASHRCEMLEDRVEFQTTHSGYFTVIVKFALPTASITVEPSSSQPAQLTVQELPGFKMEVPSTSVHSKTKITATVHYNDQGVCGNQSDHSPASACVMLEPHNTQFDDKIMITMPIPNYHQITRDNPNVKLELWHTDSSTKDAPVNLKLADESAITIHQDDNGNYLATAYVSHFSEVQYRWSDVIGYFLNFFVQNIRSRCQVFMSRETIRSSCITFEIAILLYPFRDPHSSLPNYPYMLCDSVEPVTLMEGDLECEIELNEFVLEEYRSSHNQKCYTQSCKLSRDYSRRLEFDIRLNFETRTLSLELPTGKLATLTIKQGNDAPSFSLIKPLIDHAEPPSSEPTTPNKADQADDEPQISAHPIEQAACMLIKATKRLKENVMVEGAREMAEHMKAIASLASVTESDVGSVKESFCYGIDNVIKQSLKIESTARQVAAACTEQRLKKNVLAVVDKIPAIAGQLRIISKGAKRETYSKETMVEALDLLTHNAENLRNAVEDVLYSAERAIIKLPLSDIERLGLLKKSDQADGNETAIMQHPLDVSNLPPLGATICFSHIKLLKWTDETGNVQRFYLMKRISHKWRDIGELLGIHHSELESTLKKHRGDAEECCRSVLIQWFDNPPARYPTTWHGLFDLLEDSQLGQVVNELRNVLINRS